MHSHTNGNGSHSHGHQDDSNSFNEVDEERAHFKAVLNAFSAYLPYSLASNNIRRRSYYALNRSQRQLLNTLGPILPVPSIEPGEGSQQAAAEGPSLVPQRRGLKARLDEIDDRIRRNAAFLEEIVSEAKGVLGPDLELDAEDAPLSSTEDDLVLPHSKKQRSEVAASDDRRSDHLEPISGRDDNLTAPSRPHASTSSSSHSLSPPKDLDKVRSTLKQFVRDWSSAGVKERTFAYEPILSALDDLFGSIPLAHRRSIKVLFPGCGLGRLPFEAAMRGYSSCGNEFSLFMILASHFVLNKTTKEETYKIYPWVHTMSNWRSSQDLLGEIKIPDINPNVLNDLHQQSQTQQTNASQSSSSNGSSTSSQHHRPPDFSMVAGDFLTVYSTPPEKGRWSAICTCFFLDTAKNPIRYLEVIHHLLPTGGYWINLGPLLWHFEGLGPGGGGSHSHDSETEKTNGDPRPRPKKRSTSSDNNDDDDQGGSIELTLEEVLDLITSMGFQIQERETLPRQGYTTSGKSMLTYEYECEFWVAKKVGPITWGRAS